MKGKQDQKGKYLVDFEGKKFDEMTGDEKEEFEKEKEQFYDERARIAREREENISARRGTGELMGQFNEQDDERLRWEAEALKEIGEGVTEESK